MYFNKYYRITLKYREIKMTTFIKREKRFNINR